MSAPDYHALLAQLALGEANPNWTLTPLHQGKNTVYQATAPDHAPVAVKVYADPAHAKREFGALSALQDFGISIAPQPLLLEAQTLVMSWIEGAPLPPLPALDDEDMWHRLMAAMGAGNEMHLLDFSKQVPMKGLAYQNPEDVMNAIEQELEMVDENHSLYDTLASLLENIQERIEPQWNFMPQVGLCRRNYALQDLIWDGYHLLTLDWDGADWGDMASEVGLWNAHPDFEDVPASHWAWVRWEFARLTKDADLASRATVYAQLGQVWWAVHLTAKDEPQQLKLRDRYLKRAEKLFR